MAESRWIKTSLFLMLVLQFTAAVSRQSSVSLTVREEHDVTLPCDNVREGQHKCDGMTWLFIKTNSRAPVVLFSDGQLGEKVKAQSDRLSVTSNCSLVIKKVNDTDAGYYECRQARAGQQQGQDARVYLSVVQITERNNTDKVTLRCCVINYDRHHEVKWQFRSRDIDKDNNDVRISQSGFSSSVTFLRSNYIYASRSQLLSCKVTDGDTVQMFAISPPQLSGEGTITTTDSTTTNRTDVWWLYIIVAVGLLAVIIITVALVRWKRRKGNVQNDSVKLAPATCAPESSQDMADPEDSVFYTSIIHTKDTNSKSKAQVQRKNGAESDAVTYSTVKASSADPTGLYATVN